MSRRVEFTISFDVEDDTTDDEVLEIIGNAEIQIFEAELQIPDDDWNTYYVKTENFTSTTKVDGESISEFSDAGEDKG